ncbi:MAG: sugar epimerase [Acidobacteria bacterium]|nr:MAG: sugar epimerase [Acidobacteriota bacterium]
MEAEQPRLIEGDLAVDDRGSVAFVNEFDFSKVKRSYLITNHRAGFVRAWHAHRRETKYLTVTRGAAIVGAVQIDNWQSPSAHLDVHRYVLSAEKPAVLYIPAGYANGFMSLTDDATLMFFSTSSIAESRGDDVRYDARYWDIWTVIER